MILQQHVLLLRLTAFTDEAGRLAERSKTAETADSLLPSFNDFRAKLDAFLELVPNEISRGNLGRHLNYSQFFLEKGSKERCDFQEIAENDLVELRNNIVEYYSQNKFFDQKLYDSVSKLLLVNEFSSAVQKSFNVLSDRIREKFEISETIDGKQLIIRAFKDNVSKTMLKNEKAEAIRNLLLGLYGYFRNEYAHSAVENDFAEASVVIDMVNYILFEIEHFVNGAA